MLPGLLEALKRREEVVEIAGHKIVVRQIGKLSEYAELREKDDRGWHLVIHCCFTEDGQAAFDEADIALFKGSDVAETRLLPLLDAVTRVNGFDLGDNEKK